MLVPKRKIPSVATASLVLGGSAASGCGDGPSPGGIANTACRSIERCAPDYFSDYYDSQADCRRELEAILDYYVEAYEEDYGKQCANAILRYYDCAYDEYLRTCDAYTEDACGDQYDRLDDACD